MALRTRRPLRASWAAVASCAVAAAVAPGCGTQTNPPLFGDTNSDIQPSQGGASQGGASQGGTLEATEASVPSCNLGPNGSVCACVDEPLAVDAPNIYFVLDRSGSMAMDNKWPTIISVIGQIVVGLGPRAAVGAAVFPDPYVPTDLPASLPATCAAGIEVFAPQLGNAPAGTAGQTAIGFLTALGHITADGGTPTAATLMALLPRLQSLPGKTYVVLATDGGPNCNLDLTCDIAHCQPNIDGDCPSAPASCCVAPTASEQPLANLSCLDAQATTNAVAAVAAAGIPVYVVGIPGSEVYVDLLNALAEAGGTARSDADGGDGGGTQYYAIGSTDQAAFAATLSKVAANITGSCTLTLSSVPPDPSLVNVFLDEQPVPQPGPDGWTIDGATVTLLGATCQKVVDGDVLDVRVVAGCPTFIP